MAAMIASRRVLLSKLLEKLTFSPLRPAAAPSTRFFNTDAQLRKYEDDHPDDVDPRSAGSAVSRRFPTIFGGSRHLILSNPIIIL